ncbi:MAG: YggS family pyridoxal phosphate-dependent enzyme [Clostridia bacterium]|nr:YggS family pyridoxal phosphate-dependent enzyme [Clostridia bacterium]
MTERSYIEPGAANADIEANLRAVEERIERACERAGRRRDEITLIAVSKTVEAARVNAALAAGVRYLGENRVQELLRKKPLLNLGDAEMHLIGHLQTNKVKQVVGQVSLIQSVDSLHLAQAIDRVSAERGLVTDILLEVNIGGEESKSGVSPSALESLACEVSPLSHVRVRGLMCVPPPSDTSAEKRAFFSEMYKLFLDIKSKKLDNVDMSILSMGMSSDFEEAILEGSTMVRVGTALFGRRPYQI